MTRITLLTFEKHYPNGFEQGGGKELLKNKMTTPCHWVIELKLPVGKTRHGLELQGDGEFGFVSGLVIGFSEVLLT